MLPVTLSGLTVTLKYTDRDYASMRTDFLALAASVAPDWTDQSAHDPGVAIGEATCGVGEVLAYYEERLGSNAFLSLCQDLESASLIAQMLGYAPAGRACASVNETVVTNAAGTIPRGWAIESETIGDEEKVRFECAENTVISGAGSWPVLFVQGRSYTDLNIGTSTGKPGQRFRVPYRPLARNLDGTSTLRIEVEETPANWVLWPLVSSPKGFRTLGPTDRGFLLTEGDTDAYINFGDGVSGMIPPAGTQNIRASLRIGGGVSGNLVGRGSLKKPVSALAFVASFTNAVQPSGGSEKETLEELKVNIPLAQRTNDRLVAYTDAAGLLADAGLGIAKVRAVQGRNACEIVVRIAATGPNPVPTGWWAPATRTGLGLLGGAGAYLDSKKIGPMSLVMRGAVAAYVRLELRVWVLPNYSRSAVYRAVETALRELLVSPERDYGEVFDQSAVWTVARMVEGVDRVSLLRCDRSPRARFVSGSDKAIFSTYRASDQVQDETWSVRFIDAYQYQVRGTKSGIQSSIGYANGSEFSTDSGTLRFRVATYGGAGVLQGTTYNIRTSEKVCDVPVLGDEMVTESGITLDLVGGLA